MKKILNLLKKIAGFFLPNNRHQLVGGIFGVFAGIAMVLFMEMVPSGSWWLFLLVALIIFPTPFFCISMFTGYVDVSPTLEKYLMFLMKSHQIGVFLFVILNLYYRLEIELFVSQFMNDFIMVLLSSLLVLCYLRIEIIILQGWKFREMEKS